MNMEDRQYEELIKGLETVHEYEDKKVYIAYYKLDDYYVQKKMYKGFGYGMDDYHRVENDEFEEMMIRVAKAKKMMDGIQKRRDYLKGHTLISQERERQYNKEGFKLERDAQYTQHELLRAAETYILTVLDPSDEDLFAKHMWPKTWDIAWFKPKDKITNLIKAGALIAAEIDRLKRLEDEELRKLSDSSLS